jgi:hypothetical protein
MNLVGPGKSQTYSVHAELRCFVSQLVRRTRGFAKSDAGLRRAITLFVHCWNARQMLRQLYPKYRRGLFEFIIGTLSGHSLHAFCWWNCLLLVTGAGSTN